MDYRVINYMPTLLFIFFHHGLLHRSLEKEHVFAPVLTICCKNIVLWLSTKTESFHCSWLCPGTKCNNRKSHTLQNYLITATSIWRHIAWLCKGKACSVPANLGGESGTFVTSSRYQFSLLSLRQSKQKRSRTDFCHIRGVFPDMIETKSYAGRNL